MAGPIASPLVRAAVAVLTLAVVLCLVIPMGGGDGGSVALACCFVLAVSLSVFLLRRPREPFLLDRVFGLSVPLVRGPDRTARAPDIVALGSLLI